MGSGFRAQGMESQMNKQNVHEMDTGAYGNLGLGFRIKLLVVPLLVSRE